MSNISQNKYISITSGLAVGVTFPDKNMGLRIFSQSPLLNTWTIDENTQNREYLPVSAGNATDVGNFFGFESYEYRQALAYFNYSDRANVPKELQFSAFTANDQEGFIYGATGNYKIASFNAITAGAFDLTLGTSTLTVSGLDFSTDLTLADVAARLQTAIQTTGAAAGAVWTSATVVYDTTRKSFVLTTGVAGDAEVKVVKDTAPNATNIIVVMGWADVPGRVVVNGADAASITETFTRSVNSNNNFHTCHFTGTATLVDGVWVEVAISETQALEFCEANNSIVDNWAHLPVLVIKNIADAQSLYDTVGHLPAIATYDVTDTELAHLLPSSVIASIDWDAQNGVATPNWKGSGRAPSVDDDATKDFLDGIEVSYIGKTQVNGQQATFYQKALTWGSSNDADTVLVHAAESFLKADIAASLMSIFLSLPVVQANETYKMIFDNAVLRSVSAALNNGTIIKDGLLNDVQKINLNGFKSPVNPNPVDKIQTNGYLLQSAIIDDNGQKFYSYTLPYKRSEEIFGVDGKHLVN